MLQPQPQWQQQQKLGLLMVVQLVTTSGELLLHKTAQTVNKSGENGKWKTPSDEIQKNSNIIIK